MTTNDKKQVARSLGLVVLAGAVIALVACRGQRNDRDVPETVAEVDLQRYAGTWYEIASFPQRFQKGCHATKATYSLRDDGKIRVINTCKKGGLDGELERAEGKAWSVSDDNTKLKVQFFWPFRGDYWVFDLGDDYDYAVVGSPDRESLWILNREPQMAKSRFDAIVARLDRRGWDVSRLERTAQPLE